jgi:charged multivesicular body protein 2A
VPPFCLPQTSQSVINMGSVFGSKPLKEVIRENQRMIKKSIRELEKEIKSLESNEKKLTADIKKHAKANQMVCI